MIAIGASLTGVFIALYAAFTQKDRQAALIMWAMVFVFICLTAKYTIETIGG